MLTAMTIRNMCQACVNSYNGHHGKVKEVMENVEVCKIGHTEYMIGDYGKHTVVVFQGSHGKLDWYDNLNFKKIRTTEKRIKVHEGFFRQYQVSKIEVFEKIIKRGKESVIFTGHSLGAALAVLHAYFYSMITAGGKEVICITFGSPRVGNRSFVRDFRRRRIISRRFVYKEDMVTKVPTLWMGFMHISKTLRLGATFGWELLLLPWLKIVGNPLDHYPEKYLKEL
jgi:predicted lipase